ncbi:hypothetical protein ABAC460_00245 [Asticcacaulis sp. AC460]|uniref:glycoside hydrolase family 31 protein n=1 Tax=Asticcacaulis sp. AC460 TaxID=1282360 RepID=UPI0003C3F025|nr:TIM-barrel domain-containing protein [Asticcacaulis sp. AC460]ESQ93531.1 hypothetical protein ABAC460_00245 [Asticcacaulis sp. AC460]
MKRWLLAGCISVLGLAAGITQAATPTGLDGNGHLAAVETPQPGRFVHTRLENGVQFDVNGVTKNVIFYSPTTVRVNANLGRNHWTAPSLVVIDKPDAVAFDLKETDTTLTVVSQQVIIAIDKTTGALTFQDAQGRVYTREKPDAPQSLKPVEISGAPTYEATNTFTLKPDEAIYGFGYINPEQVNRRNADLLLVQTNVGIIIPVMMSTERYGILWDTYSVMTFKDDAGGASLWAESAPGGVDYYFMAGRTLDDVVAGYRDLTGTAPMYPKQAFGLFMSKERYKTQERIIEVARTFRKDGFPLDYIVQDWQYWGSDTDGSWSGMIWDKARFPDPEGMTKAIHDLDMKLMISIWPSVGNDTELAHELDAKRLRFEPLHWISKKARIYDAYSAEGRRIYFKHVKQGLFDKGVDALWMDGTEVEVGSAAWDAKANVRDIKGLGRNALGDFSRYLNPYSLMTTQGTYDGRRATSNKRVFTLTRSAWAGAQRTAAASWSGDIFANWKTFGEQISGGVNVTITGNPYWTQDTGGFFVTEFPGGEQNPAYRELFARWFQFGAFNPIMRVHGTSIEREPYIFKELDPPVYKSLLDAVHLRYRLLPYIYSTSWQVTDRDYTLMRALPMDFPDDAATHDIKDAFMFGPSLLVHPVTRPMYNISSPPTETLPAEFLQTPDGKPGLAGQYFEGENFEVPKGKVVDATLDLRWPEPPLAELPPGLSGVNHFSARWDGYILAPEAGEYEIGIEGDDGFRLILDGRVAAEDWTYGPRRYRSAKVTLTKGQKIPVRIEFYQGASDRSLRLSWRTPSQAKALAADTPVRDLTMKTYLPAGGEWYDFWTNVRLDGGQTVVREAPLDIVPVYVRAGAILPMGPEMQYATEQPDAPYDIRIYPGADGRFTVYEDDNETYDYEKGQYATYDLMWNDAARTLTIGARKGSFPGMTQSRTLRLVVATPGQGGLEYPEASRTVVYDGKEMRVVLP